MTEPSSAPESKSTEADDDEISLLDLLIILAKHKKLIVGLPILVAMVVAGISLLMPNIFTGTTKIMPPQQSQSTASTMLAQLGGLAGLAGGVAGIKSPNDLYIGMLKSRTVADNLIQRFHLMKMYESKYPSQARLTLSGITRITLDKDGIITIEVDDKDPQLAADIANAYVDELLKLTQVLAVTDASQRRLFFERQFNQAKDNLAKAEIAARKALQSGGLVKVDDQGRAIVEITARLRGQIAVKEIQIGGMRAFAADSNPDLRLAQQELDAMRRELAKIEGATGSTPGANGSVGNGIDNLKLLREVKYYEVIFELLARQYEASKIDEAKDSAVIQVMDKAIVPDRKSKPKRAMMVLLSALVSSMIAVLLAFIMEVVERAKKHPSQAQRIATLRTYLRLR